MKPALFIADLHLSVARPAATAALCRFLQREARDAGALYILGDLFDYWIGDDDRRDRTAEQTLAGLRALADAGLPVHFMAGNRDFLLGREAARQGGMSLLDDPSTIDLFGRRTVLTHGDDLCLDDIRYQAYRRRVRTPFLQRALLSLPLRLRHGIARHARRKSEAEKSIKPLSIMDVNTDAVADRFRATGATRMIHGHTHRPARHEHIVDGIVRERWVLADWHTSGSYLCVAADSTELVSVAFEPAGSAAP